MKTHHQVRGMRKQRGLLPDCNNSDCFPFYGIALAAEVNHMPVELDCCKTALTLLF